MALMFNIPLVIYGENEAEYGNPIGDTESEEDWSYLQRKTKVKCFLAELVSHLKKYFGLEQQDLIPYLPNNPNQIAEKNIEVHYLGYYLQWHYNLVTIIQLRMVGLRLLRENVWNV